MWVRRTEEDLLRLRRLDLRGRLNPTGAAIIAVAVFATALIGYRDFPPPRNTLSEFAAIAGIFFCILYISRIVSGRYFLPLFVWFSAPSSTISFCPKCQCPRVAASPATCECGAKLEPLAHWKWIDDPPPHESKWINRQT